MRKGSKKISPRRTDGFLVDFAIDTIAIIMENYGKKWSEIRAFLSSLLGYKGFHIHFSSLSDRIAATDHMKNYELDFDDALALQAMKENRIENIISYDREFDKIPHVKRIQPENFL